MKKNTIIEKIINEAIENTDIFIVDLVIKQDYKKDYNITVYVDKPGKINISDCEALNKKIWKMLANELDNFSLEISSPGIGKAFKVFEQYKNSIGRSVEIIKINDNKSIIGILKEVNNEYVVVEKKELKEKKQEIVEEIKIPFKEIKLTKEKINI